MFRPLATFGLAIAGFALSATVARAATCESLASLTIPSATITAAASMRVSANVPIGASQSSFPFCRIAATLKPTADSDIKMELWLPVPRTEGAPGNAGWNGKFLMVGNGGWNGNIDRNALEAGMRRGYAVAST